MACPSGIGRYGSHDYSLSYSSTKSEKVCEEDYPSCGKPIDQRGKDSGSCGCD